MKRINGWLTVKAHVGSRVVTSDYYEADEVDGVIDDYECDASFNEERIAKKDAEIQMYKDALVTQIAYKDAVIESALNNISELLCGRGAKAADNFYTKFRGGL